MPNWVKNIVYALDENTDFKEFTNEKGDFTFEKIIPMPSTIYRGDLGPKEETIYGKNNWRDWSIKNWGTKWDAQESKTVGRSVIFETAWTYPKPVLIELAKKVGGLLVFYADEDIGSNTKAFFITQSGEIDEIPSDYVMAQIIYWATDLRDESAVDDFIGYLRFSEECEGDPAEDEDNE